MNPAPSNFRDTLDARIKDYEAEEALKRLSHTANRHIDRFLIALKHLEIVERELRLRKKVTVPELGVACRDRNLKYTDLPFMTRNFLSFLVRETGVFETFNAGRSVQQLGEIMQANVAALIGHVPLYLVALRDYCRTVDPNIEPIKAYTKDLENILSDLPRLGRMLASLGIPVDLAKPIHDWPPLPDRTWDEHPHWGTRQRAAEVDKARFGPYFQEASQDLAHALNSPVPRLSGKPLITLLMERKYVNVITAAAAVNPTFGVYPSKVLLG